jgi:putative tryptophan/tyrosine transport system substrate-binding protein
VFEALQRLRADALIVGADSLFTSRREQLAALTVHHAIPAICAYRDFTLAGGLMSYGTNTTNMYRQVGAYTARILKGEKPADLPVQQVTKLDLVINLKTAKALGFTMPASATPRAPEPRDERLLIGAPPAPPWTRSWRGLCGVGGRHR